VISIQVARPRQAYRDGRDKPGHDDSGSLSPGRAVAPGWTTSLQGWSISSAATASLRCRRPGPTFSPSQASRRIGARSLYRKEHLPQYGQRVVARRVAERRVGPPADHEVNPLPEYCPSGQYGPPSQEAEAGTAAWTPARAACSAASLVWSSEVFITVPPSPLSPSSTLSAVTLRTNTNSAAEPG
jgi:hypothetical protein